VTVMILAEKEGEQVDTTLDPDIRPAAPSIVPQLGAP
jgi:hypothetical protein